MASYHINITAPTKSEGSALEHAQYIQREGRFTAERYGEVAARGQANFPEWAREDTSAFWKASDEFERANGSVYREYELALPRELSREQQIALVQRFAEQELGTTRAYQWAIHTPMAKDGKEQPHVHLMFSDRQLDGIERGPEQFFKRYNSKNPERGGSKKASYGANKEEAALTYEGIRERWATVQNQALEHAGVEARVDHRSLAAQGILDREPELHRGPAVSGIEARGEVSEVGERQREQRQERAQEREAAVAEVRMVTREEMAADRVAVRERRELAEVVTGEDREAVLKRVEADRREQIERAQAMAERRVERRQSLGGRVGKKLLEQARELRERIGQQIGRVREWVRERFPDPVQQIKDRTRDLFEAVVQKVAGGGQEREPTPAAPAREAAEAVPIDWAAFRAEGRAASEGWRQELHREQAEERRVELERQEQQRQQRLEAERSARERQAQEARQAREQAMRERTVEQFRDLAANRERGRFGYGDRSEEWRATPQQLRERIDQFNALTPAARSQVLERLLQAPARARGLEVLQQQMDERATLVRSLDRGMER
jgi:hypothetical protein